MRQLKRFISIALSCCMVLSLFVLPVSAAKYTTVISDPANYEDIKGHWAEEAMSNALANGIMLGFNDSSAGPDKPITRAQMAALIVRAFEATKTANVTSFVDIKQADWYYNYISQAVQMGIISGNGNAMSPNSRITRQEAACVFCRAFNLYGYSANLGQYSDGSTVGNFARDAMAACIGAGVMVPTDGKINPQKELTRAEFTYALYQIVQTYISSQVPFAGGNVTGSVMVTTPNITLSNSSISGNMYIGDGVENGSLTLSNVQVGGTIYVRGGSKLFLTNGSTATSIVVFNPSYAVSVEIDQSSSSRSFIVDTAVSGVTVTGNVGNITMNTAKAVLSLKGAVVDTLNANVILPTISIDKDSAVQTLEIPTIAEGAKITIDGRVRKIAAPASALDFTSSSTADIGEIAISGNRGTYKFSGNTSTVSLSGGATDNKLDFTADASVNTFDIDSANDNEITVASGADMSEILFNENKSRVSMTLKAPEVCIGDRADDSRFTFRDGSDIDELVIDGDDVIVNVDKGAVIDSIVVNGTGVEITGDGKVGEVILKKGATDADIDTPNTKVTNNSGSTADVGGTRVPDGGTGTTDNRGDLDESEIKNPTKPDDTTKPTDPTNPTEPSNPTKPTEPTTTASNFSVAFPSDASAFDIYGSGQWKVTDLVTNGGYTSSTQQLEGTLHYVNNFAPASGSSGGASGYFFPLTLRSSYYTDKFTLKVDGKTYTAADLSIGPNYKGSLIFFLSLKSSDFTKKATIVYDADGDGKTYSESTLNVFFGQVKFEEEQPPDGFSGKVLAAAGIGGQQPVTVTSVTGTSGSLYVYQLSHPGLSKTTNSMGTEGYWGGVQIYGPKDAMLVTYNVTTNLGSEEVTTGLFLGENETYFEYYHDMKDLHAISMDVTWKDSKSLPLGSPIHYEFNIVNMKLLEEGEQPEPTEPTEEPIATSMDISKYPEATLKAETGKDITDFATGYNVLNESGTAGSNAGAIAGTYKTVALSSGTGPYVPLTVTVWDLKGPAQLKVGDIVLGTIPAPTNGYENYNPGIQVLVPLTALGHQVQDFTLKVVPVTQTADSSNPVTVVYTEISKAVNCKQAAFIDETISMSKVSSGTFFGNRFDALVGAGYDVITNGSGYDFKGTYQKAVANDESGLTIRDGWFAPVRVTNISATPGAWSIVVTSPQGATGKTDVKTWSVDGTTEYQDIAIPLGYYDTDDDSNFYTRVQVQINDKDNAPLATFYIDASSCTLTGLPAGKTGIGIGETGGTDPTPGETPAKASLIVSDSDTIDGKTTASFVDGNITVSKELAVSGTLKKTALKSGVNGWAVPLRIVLDKTAGQSWSIAIKGVQNDDYKSLDDSVLQKDIFVPVGIESSDYDVAGDIKVAEATVTVNNIKGATTATTFKLTFGDDLILDGWKNTNEPAPTPDPVTFSIDAMAEDGIADGKAYTDYVDTSATYSVTPGTSGGASTIAGKFKKITIPVTESSTVDVWAAPLTITASKAVGSKWSVSVRTNEVTLDDGTSKVTGVYEVANIASDTLTTSVILPLGQATTTDTPPTTNDTRFSSATVTIKGEDGSTLETFRFTIGESTPELVGFINRIASGGEDEDLG